MLIHVRLFHSVRPPIVWRGAFSALSEVFLIQRRHCIKPLVLFTCILALSSCSDDSKNTRSSATVDKTTEKKLPTGRIIRYGIFSMVRGGEIVDSSETTTGKAMSNLVMTFIKQTERIPIKKDRLLAYQYRLSNIPVKGHIQLRRALSHPPFTLPDGTVTTGSVYSISKKVETNEVFSYDVYGLNETYEMVEGEWTFQIWYQDRKLIEQKFITYWEQGKERGSRTVISDKNTATD